MKDYSFAKPAHIQKPIQNITVIYISIVFKEICHRNYNTEV